MSRVDGYILPTGDARWHFVCRLVEKCWRLGHRISICCNPTDIDTLDALLWSWKAHAFLPHGTDASHPITLGTDFLHTPVHLGIQLSSQIQMPPQFERLIEVVSDDASVKHEVKQRAKQYKHANIPIHWHTIEQDR